MELNWNCPLCGENDFERIIISTGWLPYPKPTFWVRKPIATLCCNNCDYILRFALGREKSQKKTKPIKISVLQDDEETNVMTISARILKSIAKLVIDEGKTTFTRAEVYKNINSQVFYRPSYDPIFQGMRIDQPGGAPKVSEKHQNTLERVAHGKYKLTPYGQQLIEKI